ncbi:hypothetical protein [Brachyspira pilosicoli]|uniref:hypothetical protein n=1 Tax=Brachyspira pilosicoli TaxID=52584 RepID=UPI0030067122
MNRIMMFISILSIIFLVSCKANTGPIEQSEKTNGLVGKGLKSTSPVLGSAYLWVTITTDGTTSTITLQFGEETGTPAGTGEVLKYDGNIQHIAPTANEDVNSYAFQSGTVSGVIEILSETQVNVNFSRNISPYLKINDVVCTAQ